MQEKLGSMFEDVGELKQAEQIYREAVETATAVHQEHPEIAQGLRNTTSSHWYLGMLLDRQGDHTAALENYRASLKASLDARIADASVDPMRAGEMKYSVVVGRALCKLGQAAEGVPLIRHGVEMALAGIEPDKGNRQSTYWGSELLTKAVEGLAAAGLRDEAKNLSLKMIGWVEEDAANAPTDGGPRLRLVNLYEQLGDAYSEYDSDAKKIGAADGSRLIEARRWYQQGLDQFNGIDETFRVSKFILQDRLRALQEKISACGVQPSNK